MWAYNSAPGGVSERFKVRLSKSRVAATPPRVRISPPPPDSPNSFAIRALTANVASYAGRSRQHALSGFNNFVDLRQTAVACRCQADSMCRSGLTPLELIDQGLRALPQWAAAQPADQQGELIIQCRKAIDRLEAASAEAMRRFEKSGAYKADGALGMVPWLQNNAKLAGNDAAQHLKVARRLEELPRTEEALARGEIGYGHALAMAVTAEHVGTAAVRSAEATLLKSAETMDAGRFVTVVKSFEHRVNADASLAEANWAYRQRYLMISGPFNGLARIEGQLVPEAAATIRAAIGPFLKPSSNDDRSAGQRMHDALVQVCERVAAGRADSSAPRPQLIVTTSVDTLAGIDGAPPGELQGGGTIPSDTVRRHACDAAVTRITVRGELEHEMTHASRIPPPSTKRALIARDQHCVFPGCDRPSSWCQAHHLTFWAEGGPTKLDNLALLCGAHHRKVHEERWRLQRKDGRWVATPPCTKVSPLPLTVEPRSRSG